MLLAHYNYNRHYEKIGSETKDITEEIPFEIPESWEWVRLGSIGIATIGLTYKPQDIIENGTIILRSGNIQNGKIVLDDIVRVKSSIPDNLWVKKDDILICVRNGSKRLVGKNAEIQNIKENMSFGAFMAIYRSKYNGFIKLFFDSNYFKNGIIDMNSTVINQITQNNIKVALSPLPPINEQIKIRQYVEKLFKIIDML